MKSKMLLLFLLICTLSPAQNNKVIDWINQNAVVIPDTHFTNDLLLSKAQLSDHFINATIFGFGEATHHNSEFFEMKSKFFKYLVLHQNVKCFVMEESFGAGYYINEYLQGNGGDLKTLLLHFQQGIWKNQEVFELISWMKSYNDTKPVTEKIQFYGNDCLFNYGMATILEKQLQEQNIVLHPEEQNVIAFYAKESHLKEEKTILEENYSVLQQLSQKINRSSNNPKLHKVFNAMEHYAAFLIKPTQEIRDQLMAESVAKIHAGQQAKIFVWAHNDHIKKTTVYKDNTPSMGHWLHQQFKDRYYAVGFEFGMGELAGYDHEKKIFDKVVLEQPLKNTNSEFLFDAQHDVFYIDFSTANQNEGMKKFLSAKRNYIQIGWDGLILKYVKYRLVSEKYNDMYDGLIYIKKISRSQPLK